MSFWGGSSSSPSSDDTSSFPASSAGPPQSKDDIMKAIQQNVAQQKLALLVNQMHKTCFKRCIDQPSSSLSSGENACISACVQKYMGTLDTVSKQWNKSVTEMGGAGGGPFGR